MTAGVRCRDQGASQIVKMFEKMRGKKAAAILEEADREIAVEVLRRRVGQIERLCKGRSLTCPCLATFKCS